MYVKVSLFQVCVCVCEKVSLFRVCVCVCVKVSLFQVCVFVCVYLKVIKLHLLKMILYFNFPLFHNGLPHSLNSIIM